MELDGKVAVVTGGSRGIGRRIVERFLDEGASVVFSGRDGMAGERTRKELDVGDRALFVAGDVTRRQDAERMVDAAVERYGRLDVLVNNAGGMPGFGLVAGTDDAVWHDTLAVNLHAVFYVTRRALAHLVPQQSGRIITISSISGKQGDPGLGAYVTAKHAVIGLTKVVAREVGALGITANCICPGLVMTDLIRDRAPVAAEVLGVTAEQLVAAFAGKAATGRATTVDEVAAMAVLLSSEAGAGITGAALSVDGGVTSH
ncbi:SDR family NAD(P)-dependent oxidoreductase [Saccharothrix australiensis]|uniref:3-oxoacyl-[acyl-carrier protein] reductase/meso-butanediol dehydrogenase/(S,S)-butanediol dehydrogenase/diacetyl reductase n=1 Tax=Saccharothrix australiensis TaxID=2072 RepID=A0A495VYM0_9PSEU|nr:SDR family NAD(P)-dependent oxidoreductase [Saccharothrix australiensis]RKT54512.1 3-oxoacyl-[acyl-carrier protein] reductase/meso-butanediol dehydrogenase/(S,S)-butanediol dehydrogenase/diacetyl reductase [Saccharothrix australiensis]